MEIIMEFVHPQAVHKANSRVNIMDFALIAIILQIIVHPAVALSFAINALWDMS